MPATPTGAHTRQVHGLFGAIKLLVDPRNRALLIRRGHATGRIHVGEKLLGDAHSTHIDRDRLLDACGAEYQLGRTTADINDQHRGFDGFTEPAHRAVEGQGGFLRTDDNLGLHADDSLDLAHEIRAVGSITRRRSRHEAGLRRTQGLDHPLILDGSLHRALNRRRIQVAARVHALPQAHDAHLSGQVGKARATAFINMPVGDEQSDRIGSTVNGS